MYKCLLFEDETKSVLSFQDPHVDCYTMPSIKSKLGLDREALVGLAILLGCDYLPKVHLDCPIYLLVTVYLF